MRTFGKTLKDMMETERIEQKDLAKALGMKDSSLISNWVADEYLPKLDYAIKIADYFKLSLDYLFARSEDMSKTTFKIAPPFDKQIKKIMEENKKSQYKLIKDNIFRVNTYYYWTKKNIVPKMDSIFKLADYFGVTLDYLVGRE